MTGRVLVAGLGTLVAFLGPAVPARGFWLPPDVGANSQNVVVAVGDSITFGTLGKESTASRPYPAALQGLLAAQRPAVTVRNRGVGGETTAGGLDRLAAVLASDRPGFVLIMEGTNDATFEVDPGTIAGNLRAMIRLAKANSSVPILGTIVPNHRDAPDARGIIAAVNAMLPAVAAAEDVRLVDTFSPLNDSGLYGEDRLHPTQAGYDVLAAAWQPALNDAIQDSRSLLGGVTVAGGHLTGVVTGSQVVTGFGPGELPNVRSFHTDDNTSVGSTVMPYPAGFRGGVQVAVCDVDGIAGDEIVTGAGPGGGPHVVVLKPDAGGGVPQILASFFAFHPAVAAGVSVACGDLDGDGVAEIVVAAGRGGGPHVRAFRYAAGQPGGVIDAGVSFFAYPPDFRGGVRVAVGNLDGDASGRGVIVTGAGPGGGPHVRAFGLALGAPGGVQDFGVSFFAYVPGFAGGVHVAAGDLDGDGRAELITGAGAGGGPHVRILEVTPGAPPAEHAGFFAYDPGFRGGVYVGVAGSEVVTGAGPGGGPHVRGFTVTGVPTALNLLAY